MDHADPAPVQFGEESPQHLGSFPHAGSSSLARWIIAHSGGLVPDEKRAQYVMVVSVILAIAAALFLLRVSGTRVERGGPGPSAEELETYPATQPF